MKVSNFKINPAMFALGDEVTISFTVKAESGDTIGEDGLTVWVTIPNYGETIAYSDTTFKISKGSTKSVNAKTVISFGTKTFARGDSSISRFGVQLGYYGSRVDVNFPIVLLDARYNPTITMFDGERCDADGTLNDEGLAVLLSIALAKSEAANAGAMSLLAYFRNGLTPEADPVVLDLGSLMESALAAEIQSVIDAVELNTNADYTVTLWFGDQYESATATILISRAFANMHLSGLPTGGVCFGGFSRSTEEEPLLESYYKGVFYNGIRGVTDYSEEEVLTGGTWFDGKPIYRRTFYKNNGAAQTDVALGTLTNLSDVVSMNGYVYYFSSFFPLNLYRNSTYYHRTFVNGKTLKIHSHEAFSAVVTVEYTKSTD